MQSTASRSDAQDLGKTPKNFVFFLGLHHKNKTSRGDTTMKSQSINKPGVCMKNDEGASSFDVYQN